MAVYERTYKRYTGVVTPPWSRFLVLPKYILKDVFQSKLLVGFFALALVAPLFFSAVIYLRHNTEALQVLQVEVADLLRIDAGFFEMFLRVQARFAFFLALFVGPGLISRDLDNNALPLYLCRPFSQAEYVAGKFSVLALVLSAVTWIPGLLLFVLNTSLEGWSWMVENLRVPAGLFLASWVWILILSLIALALSAWVRWRVIAAFLMFMLFMAGNFAAMIIQLVFGTSWGHLLNPSRLMGVVLSSLLGTGVPSGPPVWMSWLGLAGMALLSVALLRVKIRAYEVVK